MFLLLFLLIFAASISCCQYRTKAPFAAQRSGHALCIQKKNTGRWGLSYLWWWGGGTAPQNNIKNNSLVGISTNLTCSSQNDISSSLKISWSLTILNICITNKLPALIAYIAECVCCFLGYLLSLFHDKHTSKHINQTGLFSTLCGSLVQVSHSGRTKTRRQRLFCGRWSRPQEFDLSPNQLSRVRYKFVPYALYSQSRKVL